MPCEASLSSIVSVPYRQGWSITITFCHPMEGNVSVPYRQGWRPQKLRQSHHNQTVSVPYRQGWRYAYWRLKQKTQTYPFLIGKVEECVVCMIIMKIWHFVSVPYRQGWSPRAAVSIHCCLRVSVPYMQGWRNMKITTCKLKGVSVPYRQGWSEKDHRTVADYVKYPFLIGKVEELIQMGSLLLYIGSTQKIRLLKQKSPSMANWLKYNKDLLRLDCNLW